MEKIFNLAAIDIGSNGARLLIKRFDTEAEDGRVDAVVLQHRQVVELGEPDGARRTVELIIEERAYPYFVVRH